MRRPGEPRMIPRRTATRGSGNIPATFGHTLTAGRAAPMSKHLFGIICTHHGTAANNRAETEGNVTTLQKRLWNGDVHSTVSAEAIRWARRYWWQLHGLPTNRQWQDDRNRHTWADPDFGQGAGQFADDDILGYM